MKKFESIFTGVLSIAGLLCIVALLLAMMSDPPHVKEREGLDDAYHVADSLRQEHVNQTIDYYEYKRLLDSVRIACKSDLFFHRN